MARWARTLYCVLLGVVGCAGTPPLFSHRPCVVGSPARRACPAGQLPCNTQPLWSTPTPSPNPLPLGGHAAGWSEGHVGYTPKGTARRPRPIVGRGVKGKRGRRHHTRTQQSLIPRPPPCQQDISYLCLWVQAEVELLLDLHWLAEHANRATLTARNITTILPETDTCGLPRRLGDWVTTARCAARRRIEGETEILEGWSTRARCSSCAAREVTLLTEPTLNAAPGADGESYLGPRRDDCLTILAGDPGVGGPGGYRRQVAIESMVAACAASPTLDAAVRNGDTSGHLSWTDHLALFGVGFGLGLVLIFAGCAAAAYCTPIKLSLSAADCFDVLATNVSAVSHAAECVMIVWRLLAEGRVMEEIPQLRRLEVLRKAQADDMGRGRVCEVPISVHSLDLSSNWCVEVPRALASFSRLTNLSLARNAIETLPDSIGALVSLEALDLSFNYIREIPDSIAKLQRLRDFSLECNVLEVLPDSFTQLKRLESLNLRRNRLAQLPPDWTTLPASLTRLSLRQNALDTLPFAKDKFKGTLSVDAASVCGSHASVRATALVLHCAHQIDFVAAVPRLSASTLWLTSTTNTGGGREPEDSTQVDGSRGPRGVITTLPPALFRNDLLVVLRVPGQSLTSIPDDIKRLKLLEELDVRFCRLSSLPSSICFLSKLKVLLANGNPVSVLPWSLTRLQRLERVTLPGAVATDGFFGLADAGLPTSAADAFATTALENLRRELDHLPWSRQRHREHAYPSRATMMMLTVLAAASRAEQHGIMPRLPPEVWLHIFGQLTGRSLQGFHQYA